jgi:RNA polymerase sigma factor (sigma-70 family)
VAALARAHGLDPDDLEQSVWLRAVEHGTRAPLPGAVEGWLRSLSLHEFRRALGAARAETPVGLPRGPAAAASPEEHALAGDLNRTLRSALARLPARCPRLLEAFLEAPQLTYRQLAEQVGMPRGSIGPTRSRCLACLRRLLGRVRPGLLE